MNVDLARGSWWGIENRLVNTQWTGQRITWGRIQVELAAEPAQ